MLICQVSFCKNRKGPRGDVATMGTLKCDRAHLSANLILVGWCELLNLPNP